MDDVVATPRSALRAGATGLVGSALSPMVLAGQQYRSVRVLFCPFHGVQSTTTDLVVIKQRYVVAWRRWG